MYSRDDIWPALRAQLQLWEAIHSGFLPMLPQHRGGQLPVQEPSPHIQGFVWRELRLQLRCFKVNDDARTFLSWRSEEAPLASSPEVTAPPLLGRCLHRFTRLRASKTPTQSSQRLMLLSHFRSRAVRLSRHGVRTARPQAQCALHPRSTH